MNATMFSLFHSIKFSQFCALSDGGHSTSDMKGDLARLSIHALKEN